MTTTAAAAKTGLLAAALDAWYRRAQPMHPKNRADAVARNFGVSPSLLSNTRSSISRGAAMGTDHDQ